MQKQQRLFATTGGVHATALATGDGTIETAREDVGRHNALDKLIGCLARRRADFGAGFVFLSSRASYELVRKAARVGIPMLATISAPTSLAIDVAREAGIRLLGFCRNDGFVEYVSPAATLSTLSR
jgi:FdhD protein